MRTLALVLLVGFGAGWGVWLGQTLIPVELTDSHPVTLSTSARTRYITHIAVAYAADPDLAAAVDRLSFLGISPIGDLVLASAEWAIAEGWPLHELRALAQMAVDFGMMSPPLIPYLPAES